MFLYFLCPIPNSLQNRGELLFDTPPPLVNPIKCICFFHKSQVLPIKRIYLRTVELYSHIFGLSKIELSLVLVEEAASMHVVGSFATMGLKKA